MMSDTLEAVTAAPVDENAAAARRGFFVRQVVRMMFRWSEGPCGSFYVFLNDAVARGVVLTDEQESAVLEVLEMQE